MLSYISQEWIKGGGEKRQTSGRRKNRRKKADSRFDDKNQGGKEQN